jgi:hypothetical protein
MRYTLVAVSGQWAGFSIIEEKGSRWSFVSLVVAG